MTFTMNKPKQKLLFWILLVTAICSPVFSQDGLINARNFAETNGIAYQWFPIQKMLVMRKGIRSLRLTVNKTIATVDGREITLPIAPQIKDGQIMVPGTAIINAFQGKFTQPSNTNAQKPESSLIVSPPTLNIPEIPQEKVITVQPTIKPPATARPEQSSSEAVLVALRHSSREDHTRVVLEFNQNITYSSELVGNLYRINISGCRNLVPTRRTNPVGKDILNLDINSGPNRSGLILGFKVAQSKRAPSIETVSSPFRMIISFYSTPETSVAVATATPAISPKIESEEEKIKETVAVKVVQQEKAPEINIEVELEKLASESFLGRTIVIDPGHGGSDTGFKFPGRIPEKNITLSIAGFLQKSLEKIGLKAVLLRGADVEITQSKRLSIANRHGADLVISIHVGGSVNPDKSGVACIIFGKAGTEVPEGEAVLTEATVYKEWLTNTRFDLAAFLARRINERFKSQLKVESRGIKQLPLLPLKYIVNPAVLVEVGMLSEKTEGKNLLSTKYHEAIAACIANGVVDFFNGIVIKP